MNNLPNKNIIKIYNHLIEINKTLQLYNLLFFIQLFILLYLVFK